MTFKEFMQLDEAGPSGVPNYGVGRGPIQSNWGVFNTGMVSPPPPLYSVPMAQHHKRLDQWNIQTLEQLLISRDSLMNHPEGEIGLQLVKWRGQWLIAQEELDRYHPQAKQLLQKYGVFGPMRPYPVVEDPNTKKKRMAMPGEQSTETMQMALVDMNKVEKSVKDLSAFERAKDQTKAHLNTGWQKMTQNRIGTHHTSTFDSV